MSDLFVGDDLVIVTNNITKDAQFTDNLDTHGVSSRSDHVVLCHWRMDPVHQDVGIAFITVSDVLQERFDVITIHIVTTTFSLWLQDKSLRSSKSLFKVFITNSILIQRIKSSEYISDSINLSF